VLPIGRNRPTLASDGDRRSRMGVADCRHKESRYSDRDRRRIFSSEVDFTNTSTIR